LFVPTLAVPGLATGVDDPTQFHHLYNDDLVSLDAPGSVPAAQDYVKTWIGHYRTARINVLELDGKSINPNFQETNSLWYSMDSIAGGDSDTGLLKFIACGRAYTPNPIVSLSADLACFLPTDDPKFPNYQLSVVFNLNQKNDTPGHIPLVFGSGSVLVELFPADTGIPCPPATNCPGSGVPPGA
jgi:hypothetical protein